jgi:twitching motility protein PilT
LPPIAAPPTRSVAESPVIFHINGSIAPGSPTPLSPDDVQNLLAPMFTPEQRRDLQQKRSLDFSFVRPNGKRCRANIHYRRGTMAACTAVRNPSRP